MPRKKKAETGEIKPEQGDTKKDTEEGAEKKGVPRGTRKKEKVPRGKEAEETGETPEESYKVKEEKETGEKLLVPLDDYIKVAVHFGTKAITPGMRQFIYKRRADGIAVFNTKKIDEKISAAASFLAQYEPEKIMVCCKRDAGHKALEAFNAATGICIFKKYSAGLITNPKLENFFEPDVVIVADPWLDKNAVCDAVKIRAPVVAFCDANNPTEFVDFIIPCNNKTSKSLGFVFYLLAKLYLEKRRKKKKLNPGDFYSLDEERGQTSVRSY